MMGSRNSLIIGADRGFHQQSNVSISDCSESHDAMQLNACVKYFEEFRSKRLQGQLAHFSSRRCHPRRLGLTACA